VEAAGASAYDVISFLLAGEMLYAVNPAATDTSTRSWTPLLQACQKADLRMIRRLVEGLGADPNHAQADGSPLGSAIMASDCGMLRACSQPTSLSLFIEFRFVSFRVDPTEQDCC